MVYSFSHPNIINAKITGVRFRTEFCNRVLDRSFAIMRKSIFILPHTTYSLTLRLSRITRPQNASYPNTIPVTTKIGRLLRPLPMILCSCYSADNSLLHVVFARANYAG